MTSWLATPASTGTLSSLSLALRARPGCTPRKRPLTSRSGMISRPPSAPRPPNRFPRRAAAPRPGPPPATSSALRRSSMRSSRASPRSPRRSSAAWSGTTASPRARRQSSTSSCTASATTSTRPRHGRGSRSTRTNGSSAWPRRPSRPTGPYSTASRPSSRAQPKRRVLVRHQDERVRARAVAPAQHSKHEIEQPAGVAAGKEEREPRDDNRHEHREPEEEQHDVVRDREQPLHEREPAVQVALGVRVGDVELHRLALVGRGIAVVHQREVGRDPVLEPEQLEVPVEPPARVLLAEHDHQQRRQEEQAAGAAAPAPRPEMLVPVLRALAAERGGHDQNRDRNDQPERRCQPVELTSRVID